MFIPSAWLSICLLYRFYMFNNFLIGKSKFLKLTIASAKNGALFTFLALVTGAIWGKPMWGTWWVWDARLIRTNLVIYLSRDNLIILLF